MPRVSTFKTCKRLARHILGRIPIWKTDVNLDTVFYGSEYGGWEIVPALVKPDSIVYSFGIGADASWDLEMIKHHGVTVHAFDPTPGEAEWAAQQNFPKEFVFHDYGLDGKDRQVAMRSQSTEKQTSGTILDRSELDVDTTGPSIEVKRLTTVMKELGHDHIDLLKMDIEGAEFSAISDFLAAGIKPPQLLVETHRYVVNGSELEKKCFRELRQAGYLLFDISVREMEFGFVHKGAL